jgi:hypothetical protein
MGQKKAGRHVATSHEMIVFNARQLVCTTRLLLLLLVLTDSRSCSSSNGQSPSYSSTVA